MIGYRISQVELQARIKALNPTWINRASDRTDIFRAKGFYKEKSSIWSEVKQVYMELQGECKCAFCERKLESVQYGKGEQDVEHFRPKKKVEPWRIPKHIKDQGVNPTPVPNKNRGYYILPYHPFNYAASCKPCNSLLKGNYFPIAGNYLFKGDDPKGLMSEKPYLIYPIGDFDDDPEDLIRFHGVSPQAVAEDKYKKARAMVTIDIFKLDDIADRNNLLRERAIIIVALNPQLEKLANGATGSMKTKAYELIDGFISANSSHTNCARSFKNLFETNSAEAKAIFDRAVELIVSSS